LYYKGLGTNFCSVINRPIYLSFLEKPAWYEIEEMIIPKVIGKVKRGFLRHFRIDRMLTAGHRFRSDSINF
jgi:hypothetical protein